MYIERTSEFIWQDMSRLMHNFNPDLIVHYFLGKLIAAPQVCIGNYCLEAGNRLF